MTGSRIFNEINEASIVTKSGSSGKSVILRALVRSISTHALVPPQLVMQLAVANIHRVNPGRAVLQHAIGKTRPWYAPTSTQIHPVKSVRPKVSNAPNNFFPAARNKRRFGLQSNFHPLFEGLPGFGSQLPIHQYLAGHG